MASPRTSPWAYLPLLALCWAVQGCGEPAPAQRYKVSAGKVLSCRPDTGELEIQLDVRPSARGPRRLFCVVTSDSEIYINDQTESIDAIQLGDAVELVGYRDPTPGMERFVVTFAYFEHPMPPAIEPVFTAAAQPASQPGE